MKLRHQGLVLTSVPLLFQLVFAGLLVTNIDRLNHAISQESRAKAVIAACQKLRSSIAQVFMGVAAQQLQFGVGADSIGQHYQTTVMSECDDILKLVKDNNEALQVARAYKDDLQRFGSVAQDIGLALDADSDWESKREIFFARFLNGSEQMEELQVDFKKILDDEEKLVGLYRPLVKDFAPEARDQRQRLRDTVILTALANTAIGLLLAALFGRNFLTRLRALFENIDRFSDGYTELKPLPGNDELTELDAKFRTMANLRIEAEELKRAMMTMVAHDLRSPLSSAHMMIEVIVELDGDSLNTRVKGRLRRLDSELKRLVRLANTLLDVEQMESGKFELRCDRESSSAIVETALGALEGLAEAKKVSLESQVDAVYLFCDKERVVQVLVNLLSNSLKFTPAKSVVRLTACLVGDKTVRFEVYDQGPGIAEEERGELFQKFSRLSTDKALKKAGSGIGLYISKRIVIAHGGTIGYLPAAGGGSCFWFELPLATQSEEETDACDIQPGAANDEQTHCNDTPGTANDEQTRCSDTPGATNDEQTRCSDTPGTANDEQTRCNDTPEEGQ